MFYKKYIKFRNIIKLNYTKIQHVKRARPNIEVPAMPVQKCHLHKVKLPKELNWPIEASLCLKWIIT